MPEKNRLTPTELLSRRRNFTRMRKSNLGKRLSVPNPSVQNPSISSVQFKQLGGFGSGFTTRSNEQSTPTFRVEPNTRTAPPNQFIPNPNYTPRQISPQTTKRIQQIFKAKPARPLLRQRSRRSPLKEVLEELDEKPVRELTPKKKPWKAKWVMPKDWKKDGGR